MFAFGTDTWDILRAEEATCRAHLTLADMAHGIAAGTLVATPKGWRAVETINPGDLVRTADGGMQAVEEVTRDLIWSDQMMNEPANWPLMVPAGALGNDTPLTLLPRQPVMAEKAGVQNIFGDPFAMIPVAALEGFRKITRMAPAERMEIITLQFAQDAVVPTNGGALLSCPRARDAEIALAA